MSHKLGLSSEQIIKELSDECLYLTERNSQLNSQLAASAKLHQASSLCCVNVAEIFQTLTQFIDGALQQQRELTMSNRKNDTEVSIEATQQNNSIIRLMDGAKKAVSSLLTVCSYASSDQLTTEIYKFDDSSAHSSLNSSSSNVYISQHNNNIDNNVRNFSAINDKINGIAKQVIAAQQNTMFSASGVADDSLKLSLSSPSVPSHLNLSTSNIALDNNLLTSSILLRCSGDATGGVLRPVAELADRALLSIREYEAKLKPYIVGQKLFDKIVEGHKIVPNTFLDSQNALIKKLKDAEDDYRRRESLLSRQITTLETQINTIEAQVSNTVASITIEREKTVGQMREMMLNEVKKFNNAERKRKETEAQLTELKKNCEIEKERNRKTLLKLMDQSDILKTTIEHISDLLPLDFTLQFIK